MYEKYIVIGYGKTACDCVSILLEYTNNIYIIESEYNQLSLLKNISEKQNLSYVRIYEKDEITKCLLAISEKALILSANNKYLFSENIVKKDNLTIVNFHNALLPHYRGRNNPSWVIYNCEAIAGITWHFVNDKVDDGNIIIQKEITLTGKETALELTRECIYLGTKSFKEIAHDLVKGTLKGVPQKKSNKIKMYYSNQVPNDGYIKLDESFNKIFAILRSVDYGKIDMFDPLKIFILGKEYIIAKYKYIEEIEDDFINFKDNIIEISDSNRKLLIELK